MRRVVYPAERVPTAITSPGLIEAIHREDHAAEQVGKIFCRPKPRPTPSAPPNRQCSQIDATADNAIRNAAVMCDPRQLAPSTHITGATVWPGRAGVRPAWRGRWRATEKPQDSDLDHGQW